MMVELDEKKAREFLAQSLVKNFGDAKIVKVAGDASFRSYYRISGVDKNFILMFAPPKYEDVAPFINIGEFLVENGFKAPIIFAQDGVNGFLLLEDFGDETYGRVLANNNSKHLEENLYKNAVDCLIRLHKIEAPKIAVYNHELLFREVMLFVDWYLKFEKKIELDFAQKQHFKKLWFDLFDQLNWQDKCLVLRDYHADNLMVLNGFEGTESVGLLDFQDAVVGSKAYDLVSLLEDARRDVDEGLAQKMLRYYIENAKVDEKLSLRDYEILSLQRNLKILGIFSRLARRDKKESYLNLLPRVKKYVVARISSSNKTLEEISNFLEKIV